MITRERLEELIKQGATVYEAKYHNINPVSLSQKIRCVSYRYGMIGFEPSPEEKYLHHKYLKNLFETYEEAEWYLKFGNITRTETLSLPTWEEINRNVFYMKNGVIGRINGTRYPNFDEREIVIGRIWDKPLFRKSLTKENYLEACELCRKLFLGEEVE